MNVVILLAGTIDTGEIARLTATLADKYQVIVIEEEPMNKLLRDIPVPNIRLNEETDPIEMRNEFLDKLRKRQWRRNK